MRRHEERRVPVPAERRIARLRLRSNGHRFAGDAIDADHVAVLRFAVGDAEVGRILDRHEAVAALHRLPFVAGDAGGAAHGARPAPRVVVLHAAADVVRRRHVDAHVIEEPDRQVVEESPRLRLIPTHRKAAVVADQHVIGVRGIEPDRVVIGVNLRRGGGVHGLAGIGGHLKIDAAEDHHIGIVRIHADLTEVHRPWVRVVDFLPRAAGVVRPVESGDRVRRDRAHDIATAGLRRWGLVGLGPAAAARRRGPLDERVENVRPLAVHVEPDASERAVGKPVALHARPRFAAVGGFPDAAARPAAVHAARRAPPLIGRRVEHLIVRRVHHEIVGAGVVVPLQRLLPGFAAVHRFVDAALTTRPPQAAGGRDEDDVVVARVDDDAVDAAGRFETHVGVGLAPVRRLVDAVAPRRALAVVRLAAAHPHQIRVALRHCDVADRDEPVVLELRLEGRAAVRRLPDAPVRGADVEDRRVRLVHRKIGDAARHPGRPDRPEMQSLEGAGTGRRRGRGLAGAADQGLHAERREQHGDKGEDAMRLHDELRKLVGRGDYRRLTTCGCS